MSNPWFVFAATAALIALSAFFVIIEFALLGARRNRLEEAAATSRSARAALRGINELTIMLAGAQLGITACTFALGAVTKPAVDEALLPLLQGLGLPDWLADVAAFVLALLIVTFLHLVVGEMAPKSWAIAFPERAAIVFGIPSRAFIWPFRPLLRWINSIANRLVKASGVEPVDKAATGGRDPATLRHLVEHSANVGALDVAYQTPLAGAIELETLKIGELIDRDRSVTAVPAHATVADVQAASHRSGHMRVVVEPEPGSGKSRIVHVRDTLLEPADRPVAELSRPAYPVEVEALVHEAFADMRQHGEQLAVVFDADQRVGVVSMADILRRILPATSA
ncbi:DUF21 domain-containing protein [Epidermidibacterium keratini]|uniref:DUF21 domain-containing protein n=1 Tax=Epidermidibacterium keratini TaxID=1891644 RepID=A0A7L4YLF5_9ACTN|nr:CNNM domain-containing protein [Epidermidibacterium keratini]QHC00091.1 DUF21 domain-containing protein [Epidermidibacterium keratini]